MAQPPKKKPATRTVSGPLGSGAAEKTRQTIQTRVRSQASQIDDIMRQSGMPGTRKPQGRKR